MTQIDLAFYRRRLAQERAAELGASDRNVAAIHRRLADSYCFRIDTLNRITRLQPAARLADDHIRRAD